jgi:hypothetical protein
MQEESQTIRLLKLIKTEIASTRDEMRFGFRDIKDQLDGLETSIAEVRSINIHHARKNPHPSFS